MMAVVGLFIGAILGCLLYLLVYFVAGVIVRHRHRHQIAERERLAGERQAALDTRENVARDLAELTFHKIVTLDEALAMITELKSAPSGLQPNLFPKAWEENKAHLIGWENAFRDAVGGPLLGPSMPKPDPNRTLLPESMAEHYSEYPLTGIPQNGLPSLSREWQWVSMGNRKWRTERIVDPYLRHSRELAQYMAARGIK